MKRTIKLIALVMTCVIIATSFAACAKKRILVIDDEGKGTVTGDGKTSYETGNDEPGEDTEVNESVAPGESTEPGRLDSLDGSLESSSQGFIFASCEDGAAYKLVEYNGSSSEITIPSEYNGKPVIEIGERAFENNIVNTVIISDGVKRIEEYAFYYCAALESVSVPDSVSYIGEAAFAQCHSIRSIAPEGADYIGTFAFLNCRNLSVVSLGDQIRYIGDDAFGGTVFYNNGENWTNGVLYVGKYLIDAKPDMEGEYSVREGTSLIAANAFFNTGLARVDMPQSLSVICDGAFSNSAIKDISFGSVIVGDGAFYRCDVLSDVYYYGSEDITFVKSSMIGKDNGALLNAEWHSA